MDGSRKVYRATRKHPTSTANGLFAADDLTEVLTFSAADLAPLPPNGVSDYLLLAATKNNDLTLSLGLHFKFLATDTIQIELNGTLVGAPYVLTEADISAGRANLTLAATDRATVAEGRVAINYLATYESGGGDAERGPLGQFYITDYTAAPGAGGILANPRFSEEIVKNGVTPEVMELDALDREFLPGQVPTYHPMEPGDRITVTVNGVEDATDPVIVPSGGVLIDIGYLRSFIEARGDGKLEYGYIVTDRAGNISPISRTSALDTLLKDYLTDLEAPKVPAYDDDTDPKMVDEADAREAGGLTVLIPAHPDILATDEIEVHWGNGDTTRINGTPDTEQAIGIPYALISDEWYAGGAAADEARPVEVSYSVWRGRLSRGRSLLHTVEVNLYVAGGEQPDPDPETPENENLALPVLTSASGEENAIPSEDFDTDATITVPWMLSTAPTETPFILDDVVTVRYGDNDLQPRTIDADDLTNELDIDITLPAATIKAEGSGEVPLSYSIARALAEGGPNITFSPKQLVTADGPDDLPGGGDPLLPGSMPKAEGWHEDPGRRIIATSQARDGADFVIPVYANQHPGDVITLTSKAYSQFYYPKHPDLDSALPDRDLTIVDIHPTSSTEPTKIHLTPSQLMFPELNQERGFHQHFTYEVVGFVDPSIPVHSQEYVVDMDSRGWGGP